MGSSSEFHPDGYDVNDPYPMYLRGGYFHGSSYVRLPPNDNETSSLSLGNWHTGVLWVRLLPTVSEHYILSKEANGTVDFYFLVDSLRIPTVSYHLYDDYNRTESTLSNTGPALANWDTWTQLIVKFEKLSRDCSVTVYTDGVSGMSASLANTFFDEPLSLSFLLGGSIVQGLYTEGYIFSFKLWNYQYDPPNVGSCACSACTEDNDCLINCDYLEYYENDTCTACNPVCSTGCVVYENCRLNFDQECGVATGFLDEECIECVHLAVDPGLNCRCVDHGSYNESTHQCECDEYYREEEGLCVPCYYHIQQANLTGFFSEDYLSLVFNFTDAILTTTTNECAFIFEKSSYSKFGAGYTCTWSEDFLSLTVDLGTEPTVLNEVITFRSGKLYMETLDCAVPEATVDIQAQYLYPKPEVYPVVIANIPEIVLTKCGDLLLDVSASTGGYYRSLNYKWEFDSTPVVNKLLEFNVFSNEFGVIEIPGGDLIDSTVDFVLTLKNWLDYSSVITGSFSISTVETLLLSYDTSLSTVMKSSQSKSFYVSPGTTCETSKVYAYEWTLERIEGEDAFADEHTIWNSQNHPAYLYIPKNTLKPGEYSFGVTVVDEDSELSGTRSIVLTVEFEDLVVVLRERHITLNVNQSSVLDASGSYDPSDIIGSIRFSWECNLENVNCNDLLGVTDMAFLTMPEGALETNKEYLFSVTVYKDTRESIKTVTVHTTDKTTPSVSFNDFPSIVNHQEALSIQATVVNEENYEFRWALVSGGAYTQISASNSTKLDIKSWSLSAGSNYLFEFQVIGSDDTVSIYTEFYVNSGPSAGTFTVTPGTGATLSTVFYMEATGFQSTDIESQLYYEFGITINDITYSLNIRNETNYIYTVLPCSQEIITCWVKVYDDMGTFTYLDSTVSVSLGSLDIIQATLDYARDQVNYEWTDPSSFPVIVYLLNSGVLDNEESSDVQKGKAMDLGVDCVAEVVGHIRESSEVEVALLMLKELSNSDLAADAQYQSAILALMGELKSLNIERGAISENEVLYYSSILESAMNLTNYVITEGTGNLEYVNTAMIDILSKTAGGLLENEYKTISSRYITTKYTVLTADLLRNFVIESEDYSASITATSFDFASTLKIMPIFIVYTEESTEPTEQSTAVEFSIINLENPAIPLNTNAPVFIEIPIRNIKNINELDCVFREDSLWKSTGCSLNSTAPNSLICECRHLSLYSAGTNLDELRLVSSSKEALPTEEIMVVYIGFLCILWSLLSLLLLPRDKAEYPGLFSTRVVHIDPLRAPSEAKRVSKPENIFSNQVANQETRQEKYLGFFGLSKPQENVETTQRGPTPRESVQEESKIIYVEEEGKHHITVWNKEALKKHSKKRRYYWAQQYYFSSCCFKKREYSRLARLNETVLSLILQSTFIGVAAYFVGKDYESSIEKDTLEVASGLGILEFSIVLLALTASNSLSRMLLLLFKRRHLQDCDPLTLKRLQLKRTIGAWLLFSLVVSCVVFTVWISVSLHSDYSVYWCLLASLCVCADFLCVQNSKVFLAALFLPHDPEEETS